MSYRPIGSIIKFSLLGDVIVKCFTMTSKNHFLFSNRLFQFFSNQRPDRNSRNQLFVFSAVVVYTLPFLVQMHLQFFTTDLTMYLTVKLIQKIVAAVIILCAYSIYFFHYETIKLLIAHIQLDHEKLTDKEELKIMKKYTVQNKSYTYILVVLFNVYCFLIIFPCIFNVLLHFNNKLEDKQLTLPLIENSIGNHGVLFYSMLLSQIIVIIIVEAVSCISFSPFFVFIQHACYQCSILILKIHQPFDKNHKSGKNVRYFYTQTEEYNWIIDIINRHQKSIEYGKILRYLLNKLYLIICLLSMILIVFNFVCILQYSDLLTTAEDIIEFSLYAIVSLFTIYINFYLGQKLLNHSNGVFEELCNIPFYTLSRNSQKLLIFMIAKSGKPIFLTIGNMFDLTYEVFAKLLQKSFSFAMVYYSAQ